ncbi:hypothetical protein [Paraburkholderia sp. BL6669N2]|uniref:hypothetical protein n=1 Tax=Paraburkholderia sp. BL6669N2 TaxID=1938807 RepID=UPI0011C03642|nr:hypothetical protein [Paraburkholderia sp. BL6669N2]
MNEFQIIDMYSDLVPLGRLEQLKSLGYRPKQSIGLPQDMPVLTCPVAAHDAECFSMKDGQLNFGFGTIQTQHGLVQSIRLQLNDVQIYWLADMTDPEVWAALDKWRKAGHALIQFDVRGQTEELGYSLFLKAGVPHGTYRNEQFRNVPAPSAQLIWDGMATLAMSGKLQRQAESDIEGMQLRRVFVNVLLTGRFKPWVAADKMVEMPTPMKIVFQR